ncbi:MAG: hypothetical protein V3U79_04880 [Dehalococcoidia bacterium]
MIPFRNVFIVAMALTVLAGPACGSAATSTPDVTAAREKYLEVFEEIRSRIFTITSLMVPVSTVISANFPGSRDDFADTTNQILDEFNLQLRLLEGLEPVPQELQEAHDLMMAAINQYLQAAILFLPGTEEQESLQFDNGGYSGLMSMAGFNFHRAGELAMNSN